MIFDKLKPWKNKSTWFTKKIFCSMTPGQQRFAMLDFYYPNSKWSQKERTFQILQELILSDIEKNGFKEYHKKDEKYMLYEPWKIYFNFYKNKLK